MGLNEFLVWLTGGGVVICLSWLFERIDWYQNLEAKMKRLVFFLSCVLVALGAYAVQVYVPADILSMLAPYFAIVASLFYQILGDTFHKNDKAVK